MRRPLFKSGLVVAFLVFAVVVSLVSREPSYQGQTVSEWLENLNRKGTRNQAITALRQLGADALPRVIAELRAEDSPLKLKLIQLLKKQSVVNFNFTPASVRRDRAIQACDALGPLAKPAISALGEALGNGSSRAVRVLEKLGPDAIPALAGALTNAPGCGAPYATALALGRMGSASRVAVTNLVWELDNYRVGYPRAASAKALSEICRGLIEEEDQPACPEVVFAKAALIRGLSHSHWATRRAAADSLGALKGNAREATAALTELLEDERAEVRKSATNALKALEPESAPAN